jgi:hypothetical protein
VKNKLKAKGHGVWLQWSTRPWVQS